METATITKDVIALQTVETLPDGVKVAIVPCANYAALANLPNAIEISGECYGRTGWNSDRFVAYFRTDTMIARAIR